MRYGTLIDGQPIPAPNPVHINGRAIYNPSGSTYAAMGYKPIVETPMPDVPESDTYYTPSWIEQDSQIVRVWEETDPPAPKPTPPTMEQRMATLETQLAETDEAAIELYEASLAQEAVNAEQDEAIIEIYETMEGIING